MALALSLDTSTPFLSAALVSVHGTRTEVLATRFVGPPAITSTLVPGVFDEMLAETGTKLEAVDLFVAGLGPGLFTGTRVAVGTMKALAYARRRPLLGAGSLEAMAVAASRGSALIRGATLDLVALPATGLLCPALDARKGEVYAALYRVADGSRVEVLPPAALSPRALLELLGRQPEPVRCFGTGAVPLRVAGGTPTCVEFAEEPIAPGAAEVAALACARHEHAVFDAASVLALEPRYLRPPEAEVARRKREESVAKG
jgi:tRNA threonylcarbamoyladenosine biosynthesis protein TsaB